MKLGLADYLSLSRIPLAFIFVLLLFTFYDSYVLLTVLILTILSDVFDGFLARNLSSATDFGATLDPLCDKAFIILAFLGFLFLGRVSLIIFFAIIIRDIYSLSEILYIKFSKSKKVHKAGVFGKLTTTAQFILIGVLIFQINILLAPIVALVFILSLFTVGDYVKGRRLK